MELTTRYDPLTTEEQGEFKRRESLVHAAMQSLLLSPRQSEVTVERMINLLTVMVQESIFVFAYLRLPTGVFEYVPYFDFDHALSSRNVLTLCRLSDIPGDDGESQLEPVLNIAASLPSADGRRLFQVGTSNYYLRVFRLADDDSTTRFVEIPADASIRKSPATKFKSQAIFEDVERYRVDIERYLRLCVRSFTGSTSAGASAAIVQKRFACRLSECLDRLRERIASDALNVSRVSPLRSKAVARKDDPIFKCLTALRKPSMMLGRTHDRMKKVSIDATALGDDVSQADGKEAGAHTPAVANFFVALRTYGRTNYRCDKAIDATKRAYDVHYVMPTTQVDEMADWLVDHKSFLCSDQEVFGRWLEADQKRYAENGYVRNLAKRAHMKFWEGMSTKQRAREFLHDLFTTPVGDEAISFVEPVFSGLTHFRHPFRRLAGLARVARVWTAAQNKQEVAFDDLDKETDQKDALRTVAMFYATRAMAGRTDKQRSHLRTKVILAPLNVAGAVCGVIGAAVLEPHHDSDEDRAKYYVPRLGVEATRLWNSVWHLHHDVFAAVERDLRRYIRDLQIEGIQKGITDCLLDHFNHSVSTQRIYPADVENALKKCNAYSDELARFAPYPLVNSRWLGQRPPSSGGVRLETSKTVGVELTHAPNLYFGPNESESRYGLVDLNYVLWRLKSLLHDGIGEHVSGQQAAKQAASYTKQ